jgi:DNA-binding MarR family transcriptional regulator
MFTVSVFWALAWKLLIPAVLLVAVADVLTQSPAQRVRRLYRSGNYSQRTLAARLGVTRHAIRAALA